MARIRVLGGNIVAGYNSLGARINVLPGEYEAAWIGLAAGLDTSYQTHLRLYGAAPDGGELDISKAEYPEAFDKAGGFSGQLELV